jgi:hypothetical protein
MVVTMLQMAKRSRPLSMLSGTLRDGRDVDLSQLEGAGVLGFPPGEAMFFRVGDDDGWFVFRQDDFKFGSHIGETIQFSVGKVTIVIGPHDQRDDPGGLHD